MATTSLLLLLQLLLDLVHVLLPLGVQLAADAAAAAQHDRRGDKHPEPILGEGGQQQRCGGLSSPNGRGRTSEGARAYAAGEDSDSAGPLLTT